jgi:hypothetical protein
VWLGQTPSGIWSLEEASVTRSFVFSTITMTASEGHDLQPSGSDSI